CIYLYSFYGREIFFAFIYPFYVKRRFIYDYFYPFYGREDLFLSFLLKEKEVFYGREVFFAFIYDYYFSFYGREYFIMKEYICIYVYIYIYIY
ncbi:hypothetical protein RhiirA4_281251, partial [Rhizophagus irregularis]